MEQAPLRAPGPRSEERVRERLPECALDIDYPVNPTIDRLWKASEKYIKVALGLSLAVTVILAVVLSVLEEQRSGGESGLNIRFLVVGDWGRQGEFNQSLVAAAMGRRADRLLPEFVISTGDNFYPHGLNSTDDPLFDESFAKLYTAQSLQVPWHAVLGNHDFGDGNPHDAHGIVINPACYPDKGATSAKACPVSPMYQLGAALINRDPRWHCERRYTLPLAGGLVQFFFLDTTPFVKKYRDTERYPWARLQGGVLEQSWESQLKEFEAELAESQAAWKIVVGHHPPHSNGEHGNNVELIETMEPLFSKYGVQAYFAGHDHSLEHLYVDEAKYHIIVSGAGSKCQRGFIGEKLSRYQWPSSGFVAATLTPNELTVEFHHLEEGGSPAYVTKIPRVPT